MSMLATYADPAVFTASPWSVDVSGALRRGSVAGLIERAELGSTGISSIVLDDPDGTLGHSSDAILGLKQIWVDETDCPAGDQRIYTGFIADRKYRRGDSLITGVARKIDVTLVDANEILTERILHLGFGADPAQPCDRPAETDFERIAWLLITGYVRAVFDLGLVASTGPVNMDACDYSGQKPADVMNDCSQQSGRNHFVYFDEASETYGLFYDFNNAAVYSSSLRISNVLADVDNVTTFAPQPDAELTRDPSRVSAGVYMPFSGGTTYQELLGTAVTYAFRDAAAPSSNVTTLTNAEIRADRYLAENATEEDRITPCTIKLPKAKVTGIKAGHRILAKFSHLPGMTGYTWCRILTRTVKQDETTPEFYNVDLELDPVPVVVTCSTAVSTAVVATTGPKNLSPDGWPTVSVTPVAGPAIVLGLVVTVNGNSPTDTALLAGAGWTLLDQGNAISGHPLVGVVYKAIASASGAYTPNATYTPGYGSGPTTGNWAMMGVAMQSAAAGPVQHAFASCTSANPSPSATLGVAPTVGNILVLVAWPRDGTVPSGPLGTGWTALGSTYATGSTGQVYAWARCVVPGDGTSYGVAVSGGETLISISEWATA